MYKFEASFDKIEELQAFVGGLAKKNGDKGKIAVVEELSDGLEDNDGLGDDDDDLGSNEPAKSLLDQIRDITGPAAKDPAKKAKIKEMMKKVGVGSLGDIPAEKQASFLKAVQKLKA